MHRSKTLHLLLSLFTLGIIMMLVEFVCVPLLLHHIPPKNALYRRMTFVRDIARSADAFDVLFLGDSTAKRGIIPILFEEITGSTGYNLATYGTVSPFLDPYLLRTYLKHHAPPKAVVVVNTINIGMRPLARQTLVEDFPNAREEISILVKNTLWPWHSHMETLISNLLPSLRKRYQIRRNMRAYLSHGNEKLRPIEEIMQMKGLEPDWIAEWNEEYDPSLPAWDFSRESEFGRMLEHLCQIASQGQTRVFVTFGPMSDAFSSPMRKERVERKMKNIKEFLATQPSCTLLDGPRMYERIWLENDTHVNETGAILFTQQLAQELMPFLNAE